MCCTEISQVQPKLISSDWQNDETHVNVQGKGEGAAGVGWILQWPEDLPLLSYAATSAATGFWLTVQRCRLPQLHAPPSNVIGCLV